MSPSPTISPPPLKRRKLSSPTDSIVGSDQPAIIAAAKVIQSKQALAIYSWNINGIKSFIPSTEPKITKFFQTTPRSSPTQNQPSLRRCLRNWKWPHLVCLQEVKIASTDAKTQAQVQKLVNARLDSEDEGQDPSRRYVPHFSLPRDKHNATGFGGKVHGVCSLVRQDLAQTVTRTVAWDLEGRILITELEDQALAIVNTYAVNGTTYDYRDPSSGKVTGTRHDHKRFFHSKLRDEVHEYRQRGWEVLIIGDINISRTTQDSFPQLRLGEEHVQNRADFESKIIRDAGMLDTFRHLNGNQRQYTYRPTHKPWGAGGDRVDMALVTQGLAGRLAKADMLDTEADRGPSDHVPIFVQLAEDAEES